MKKIAIITYDEQDSMLFSSQIEGLFSGLVSVDAHYTNSRVLDSWPVADLYLIGNSAFGSDDEIVKHIAPGAEWVKAESTFTKKAIARLKRIPAGTSALFVSCNEPLCNEAITRLQALGVQHIDLHPYYPGVKYTGNLEYAITPGEYRYMPEVIQYMIDVGGRLLDANTIMEVAIKLKLDHLVGQNKLKDYFELLADNTYSFDKLFERSVRSENRLDILLDTLSDGIIGADEQENVFAYNAAAERILNIAKSQVMGRKVGKLFDFIPFDKYKNLGVDSEPLLLRHKGVLLNVTIRPIVYNGKTMGAYANLQRFKDLEKKQSILRSQLNQSKQCAKYTFDDIICRSRSMEQAANIAKKMAQTNSSILITGESGTGKELFVHAIHKASARRDCPFVAINCAALPDNLLESELFGYEEGAFTGAKKGGKMGLFEFANSGTIFLDEVEAMSPTLQVKLLRVLQEREIMHIGGGGIIHVDVRVIATSNESLEKMVEEGRFRSDLYYRLNTLPIFLPPLRDRRDDIESLVAHFQQVFGKPFDLNDDVWALFMQYPWKGNVRELRNCVEYLSFLDKPVIELADLPPAFSVYIKQQDALEGKSREAKATLAMRPPNVTSKEYLFLLERLKEAYEGRRKTGRSALLEQARTAGLLLSQGDVRFMLGQMESCGLVRISVGPGGTQITEAGIEAYQNKLIGR